MMSSTHDQIWFDRNDGMQHSMINSINVVTKAVDAVELYSYTRPESVISSANKPMAPNAYRTPIEYHASGAQKESGGGGGNGKRKISRKLKKKKTK